MTVSYTTGGKDWLLEWFDHELPTANRQEHIEQLSVPVLPSFVQEEAMGIRSIAAAQEDQRAQLLNEHVEQWHWVENSYIESTPLTQEQFQKKVNAELAQGNVMERLQQAQAAIKQKQQQKELILESVHASSELRGIVNLSDRISHMTDLRKMGVLRLNHWTWQLLRDIEKETSVPFETLVWSRQLELEDAVRTANWSVMKERQHTGNLTLIERGEWFMCSGSSLKQLNMNELIPPITQATSVRGQTAFPGVVEGIAKVIRGRRDFEQFIDGDILITNQTTPEFVPLMKRARAVVTEQGGITCHAAIVSRELQIPCIIGTQTAMSVFRSGEQIVVDATSGEVRKKL